LIKRKHAVEVCYSYNHVVNTFTSTHACIQSEFYSCPWLGVLDTVSMTFQLDSVTVLMVSHFSYFIL